MNAFANTAERHLRHRIEVLEEENAYLKQQLGQLTTGDDLTKLQRAWGLSITEAKTLLALHAGGGKMCSHAYLMDAVYPDPDNAPFDHVLNVIICKVRRKLIGRAAVPGRRRGREGDHATASYQTLIENILGRGYALTPAGMALVTEALGR